MGKNFRGQDRAGSIVQENVAQIISKDQVREKEQILQTGKAALPRKGKGFVLLMSGGEQ